MATLTIKINEKSKTGKNFLLFLKQFIKSNDKAIEIIREPNVETIKAMKEARKGINMIKAENAKDLIRKLNS